MAIQQNFTSVSPSLSLNFARSKVLDPRITFTRTSTGTVLNERGIIETVPAGSPRFDHEFDATTGSIRSLGLLIEEPRVNLEPGSENFTNANSWLNGRSSYTSNVTATLDPAGGFTADKLVEDTTASNSHFGYKAYSGLVQNGTYTFSIFAKRAERFQIGVGAWDGVAGLDCYIDLTTGTIISVPAGVTMTVIPYPNQWYRICYTRTIGQTTLQPTIYLSTPGGASYTGDGSSGLYLWGAQLEQGAFASSYIPTTTATVGRTPDNVFLSGVNFTNWYNESEGTIYVQYRVRPGKSSAYDRVYSFNLNSTPSVEEITLVNNVGYSTQRFGYVVYDNSSAIADTTGTNNGFEALSSSPVKTAMWYKSGNYAFTFRGNNALVNTSSGVPSPNVLDIGRVGAGSYLNGTISEFLYYPRTLGSYSLLQNLTK